MDIGLILSGGLIVAILGLGIAYWRSQRIAQATQTSLQQELEQLRQTSEQMQQHLNQQLQETAEKLQTTQREKGELETQVEALKQQCLRLRDSLAMQAQQVQQDVGTGAFEQIQTLLVQYPSVQRMAAVKPDLPARNVVALLNSLENLVKFWGYTQIGSAWESVAYDPQLHQGDTPDLQIGESVYVRFVGYRQGERILIPAKVSRTLPAGASS